jgi:uncharacterized BrkB/YihY/UPF0761 family membrane protein
MNALEDALNAVYKVKESRALWRTYAIALVLTVSASLLIIAALTVFLYGGDLVQLVSDTVGLKPAFYWTWRLTQWPIAVFFVSLVASMVYYAAPNPKQRRWQWLSPGALFATLGWIAASGLQRLYFHFFTSYARTYGSLGAVMVLMTWLYVTGTMLLLGAEVNKVIEVAAVCAHEHKELIAGDLCRLISFPCLCINSSATCCFAGHRSELQLLLMVIVRFQKWMRLVSLNYQNLVRLGTRTAETRPTVP